MSDYYTRLALSERANQPKFHKTLFTPSSREFCALSQELSMTAVPTTGSLTHLLFVIPCQADP